VRLGRGQALGAALTGVLLPCSSVLAHTTHTSAIGLLVIQNFAPFKMKSPPGPSCLACVTIEPGSLPELGSVRPKQPTISPAAMPGSHFWRCSSVPYV
jgi:hypothetical protein